MDGTPTAAFIGDYTVLGVLVLVFLVFNAVPLSPLVPWQSWLLWSHPTPDKQISIEIENYEIHLPFVSLVGNHQDKEPIGSGRLITEGAAYGASSDASRLCIWHKRTGCDIIDAFSARKCV